MCNGTRGYNCWNGVTFHGELAAKNISAKVLAAMENLPEFDQVLLETIEEEAAKFDTERLSKISSVEKRIAETERQIANVSTAIAEGKQFTSLLAKLEELELSLAHDRDERRALACVPATIPPIPSVAQIRKDAVLAMQDLAVSSQEFAALMRKLVSSVAMYPFIPCDGGHPVLRARVAIDLRNFLPENLRSSGFTDSLRSNLIVDCFDPFERYAILGNVIELKRKGQRLRDIGQQIGQTFSLVQKASAIDDIMVRRGLQDPYIEIVDPDMLPSRMRRHKHQRYNFKRIDDAA